MKKSNAMRILFVASEAIPWVKTGGLADMVGALTTTLTARGHDVRLLLPGYADVLSRHPELETVPGLPFLRTPPSTPGPSTWFYLAPCFSERPGNPYLDPEHREWADNGWRFGRFSLAAAALAGGRVSTDWQADVVHCHDWQTGLVPLYLQLERVPAASLFTIHNLAFRGLFPPTLLPQLKLPWWLWHADALEFHDNLSLIKGGMVFADTLTTVSPTYAREITTGESGQGLDGLLRYRQASLHGILNGIDDDTWNPATDPWLAQNYSADDLDGKAVCKAALQRELGLAVRARTPLLGVVARFAEQKGIDLILQALPALLEAGCQIAALGAGDRELELRFAALAQQHPRSVSLSLGMNESLAHRIEAGADIFLMPSRFEPCGLNQMYSQRYGTPPVAHRTGGLADSIRDADEHPDGTGFLFTDASVTALLQSLQRALAAYRKTARWREIQIRDMQENFGWAHSADQYETLYRRSIEARRVFPEL